MRIVTNIMHTFQELNTIILNYFPSRCVGICSMDKICAKENESCNSAYINQRINLSGEKWDLTLRSCFGVLFKLAFVRQNSKHTKELHFIAP